MAKKQNIKQKQYCNKFNQDFKNGPHQKKKKKESHGPEMTGYGGALGRSLRGDDIQTET